MSEQVSWAEHIKDHIEHKLWRNERLSKALIEVRDDVKTRVLESDKIVELINQSATDCDCHTLGHDLKQLFESELAEYCERNKNSLENMFPAEFEEYQEGGCGGCDEVDV